LNSIRIENAGNGAAADRMKQINEAYAVLSDPHKRREYDLLLNQFGHRAQEQFRQSYSEQDIFRESDVQQIFEEMARAFGLRDSTICSAISIGKPATVLTVLFVHRVSFLGDLLRPAAPVAGAAGCSDPWQTKCCTSSPASICPAKETTSVTISTCCLNLRAKAGPTPTIIEVGIKSWWCTCRRA
jgi:hypothetical protein